jgi:glutathione S-transferase
VKLLQIPFSHNSIKVRRVLALKGLEYERENVNPAFRRNLVRLSGQELTPVLVDGRNVFSDSTAIALYLEETYPDPPLVPPDAQERTQCLLLEDWADAAFMALTRRLAYWTILNSEASLGDMFFPKYPKPAQRIGGVIGSRILRRRFGLSAAQAQEDGEEARRVAKLAVDRIGGGSYLIGDRISLADVALASMSAPLRIAPLGVADDPAVKELLAWDRTILEDEFDPPEIPPALLG